MCSTLAALPAVQDVAGLCRVRKLGVPTPVPLHVNPDHGLVFMSKVDCSTLKQCLNAAAEVDAGEAGGCRVSYLCPDYQDI